MKADVDLLVSVHALCLSVQKQKTTLSASSSSTNFMATQVSNKTSGAQ